MASLGSVQRFAVVAVLVLDVLDALAFDGAGHDDHRLALDGHRLREGVIDGLDIVTVDDDGVAAEGSGPIGIRGEVPPVHGLAALTQPVDVPDRDEVVQLVPGCVFERLPHGAFGQLAVAAEGPHAERKTVEPLPRQGHPDAEW